VTRRAVCALLEKPPRGLAQRLPAIWLTRGAVAWAMQPLSLIYAALAAFRRLIYRAGLRQAEQMPVPVIVVGNLIAGGAGKTPTVIAIVGMLKARGYAPGVISRGYGGHHRGVVEVTRNTPPESSGDEPLLIHLRTGAPVVVGRDRCAAARGLLAQHRQVDVIVSDDGLQHLGLARSAQVIVFDERGAGNGWLLPAGPLRETLPSALPSRSLVIYNATQLSTPLPGTLARRALTGVVELAAWWRGDTASLAALQALATRPLIAAAGVARPERFFKMLREAGLTFSPLALPDHHAYATLPWPTDTPDVVLTEKDAIKLDIRRLGRTRVWVAPLDFQFDAAFNAALLALLPPPGTQHGNSLA
jgi:tetraacyldisaccharide 4'-kinase